MTGGTPSAGGTAPALKSPRQGETGEETMPNWCTNNVVLEGTYEELEEAFDVLTVEKEDEDGRKRPQVTFNKLVQMPEILRRTHRGFRLATADGEGLKRWCVDTAEDGTETVRAPNDEEKAEFKRIGQDNWYEWAIAKWGTKWDASYTEVAELDPEEGKLRLSFSTAGGPPEPVIDAITSRWPGLIVTGTWHVEGGRGSGSFD